MHDKSQDPLVQSVARKIYDRIPIQELPVRAPAQSHLS